MEIKKVRKHTCFQNGLGQDPLNPKNCNCRKYIAVTEAALLVKESEAQYVVVRYAEVTDVCPVCDGQDEFKNSCIRCEKTGKIIRKEPVYGEDIIVSVGVRQQRTIKKKTPRSPTIERNHIYRGLGIPIGYSESSGELKEYVVKDASKNIARDRWDEFQLLTIKERLKFLITDMKAFERIYNSKSFNVTWKIWSEDSLQFEDFPWSIWNVELRYEPPDNYQAGTGRRYDYGRSV